MNNQWHKKESPIQGLTGMWGGNSSNLASGAADTYTNSLQYHYSEGTPAGLQTINFGGVERTLNYTTYNSKGWAEIMFVANAPWGSHNAPGFHSGTFMLSQNLHATNGGLDYTADLSKVMVGNDMTPTDFVITSKQNAAWTAISPVSGQNQGSALPLSKGDLTGTNATEAAEAMMAYMRGTVGGWSGYQNSPYAEGTTNARYDVKWSGPSPNGYGITLLSRSGSPDTDHWFMASGQSDTSSTYHGNIGFRGTTSTSSWYAKNVGSWSSDSNPKNSQYEMDGSNVFSFWMTDM